MGKSSLMIRTAARLREAGASVVLLDLTAIGGNLTAEQWYDGMLEVVGEQLGLEQELEAFWEGNEREGPLRRWMRALREVVLEKRERVVVFVDEIDAVLNLPFSADEFFAGIREVYNRRAQDRELERLAFCLLGVATPSDLIRDTRLTPFNIANRIELEDFTQVEARSLERGLARPEREARALLGRVLYWTRGHPYLTQRLCHAVASLPDVRGPREVDRLCTNLFLSPQARECDDNLLFVRDRLLRSEVEVPTLLGVYEDVWKRRYVSDDEIDPAVSALKLTGIVRSRGKQLYIRNNIYRQVFDQAWIRKSLPGAELDRKLREYRKRVLQTSVFGLVLITITAAAILLPVIPGSVESVRIRRPSATSGSS
jgi:hypothetical protein